ncbi:MAG TPA: hypothetical protein EYO33_04675 [Phycisphaerales bacterium]|nr:hypothetical protein [Phycisphaerales bacterium]
MTDLDLVKEIASCLNNIFSELESKDFSDRNREKAVEIWKQRPKGGWYKEKASGSAQSLDPWLQVDRFTMGHWNGFRRAISGNSQFSEENEILEILRVALTEIFRRSGNSLETTGQVVNTVAQQLVSCLSSDEDNLCYLLALVNFQANEDSFCVDKHITIRRFSEVEFNIFYPASGYDQRRLPVHCNYLAEFHQVVQVGDDYPKLAENELNHFLYTLHCTCPGAVVAERILIKNPNPYRGQQYTWRYNQGLRLGPPVDFSQPMITDFQMWSRLLSGPISVCQKIALHQIVRARMEKTALYKFVDAVIGLEALLFADSAQYKMGLKFKKRYAAINPQDPNAEVKAEAVHNLRSKIIHGKSDQVVSNHMKALATAFQEPDILRAAELVCEMAIDTLKKSIVNPAFPTTEAAWMQLAPI